MKIDETLDQFINQALSDSGCEADIIEKFKRSFEKNEQKALSKLLSEQRNNLLDALHGEQKKIDCLDYFIYKMKKEGHIQNGA